MKNTDIIYDYIDNFDKYINSDECDEESEKLQNIFFSCLNEENNINKVETLDKESSIESIFDKDPNFNEKNIDVVYEKDIIVNNEKNNCLDNGNSNNINNINNMLPILLLALSFIV